MDFTTIGTLHTYAKQQNLKFAAKYKQKTGQSLIGATGNLQLDLKAANNNSLVEKMMKAQQQDNGEYSKKRISSIKQKLLNGKRISNEELGYLRKHDPDLYQKAQKAQEARDELKAALRKAKTKEEARKAVTQALMKASAEALAELKAAKGGVGGAGKGGSDAVGNAAGYEATQEIGGPNAEAVSAYVNGDEASMVKLNEQITATATAVEGDTKVAELNEAQTLKDINADIAASSEVEAEIKSEAKTAEAEANNKLESSNSSDANNTNPLENSNNDGSPVSGIMEKFIMVIRAIEDEWAEFAKSDDYKELAEDMLEEAKRESSGKRKRQKHSVDKPNQHVMDVIATYRKAMMYNQTATK